MNISTRRYLLWLGILIIVVIVFSLISFVVIRWSGGMQPPTVSMPMRDPPPRAALSAGRTVQAIGGAQFSLLLSYTDGGFEPRMASIRRGETIRFMNNSTHDMSIVADEPVYPETNTSCKGSALDTCEALPPGEYREVTFGTAGQWGFHDKANPSMAGSVTVQ